MSRELHALVDRRIALATPLAIVRGVVTEVDLRQQVLSAFLDGADGATPGIAIPAGHTPAVGDDILVLRRPDGYLLMLDILAWRSDTQPVTGFGEEVRIGPLEHVVGENPSPLVTSEISPLKIISDMGWGGIDLIHAKTSTVIGTLAAAASRIRFIASRGSLPSPEDIQANDTTGSIAWHGRMTGLDWSTAGIASYIDGAFTTHPPGAIVFQTRTADTAGYLVARWTLRSSGTLEPSTTSTTDIGATDKVVQHVHAEGIAFPATQVASATANTLDDYEEGTWTPALRFDSYATDDLDIAYTTQIGIYTKVGRLVTCGLYLVTSTFTHTSASGNLQVTGLPFACNAVYAMLAAALSAGGWTRTGYIPFLTIAAAASYATVSCQTSGAAIGTLGAAYWPTGGTVVLRATFSYIV